MSPHRADEPIPISLVVHYLFCPRRAWLEVQGERVDSAQMQAGFNDHRRVDSRASRGKGESSSVDLFCEDLGVKGKTDVVFSEDGEVRIREYKSTPMRKSSSISGGMRVQLALQKLCLESAGESVAATEIYFTTQNQVVEVVLTEEDERAARSAVKETRRVVLGDTAPMPFEDDPRCSSCSHAEICLPDEHYGCSKSVIVRAPIEKGNTVYLSTPGSYARLKKGRMIVEKGGETIAEVPLETVHSLRVHGNVNLSGGLIKELLSRSVVVQWCTGSGRVVGWSESSCGPNGQIRQRQCAEALGGNMPFAREFIASKISNQATQVRRAGVDKGAVDGLRALQRSAEEAENEESLLGIEGRAAALYFAHWKALIKERYRNDWEWHGRSGRPARDAINAMLNYAYSLLVSDEIEAIVACGLDPHAGFLHSSNRNKPALALDLMEEMRAPIVDSAVQTAINCQLVRPDDFDATFGTIRMRQRARKALIQAYENRLTTEFTHPLFGYKVTWRRALEVQARQVLGVLEGSLERYKGVRVR